MSRSGYTDDCENQWQQIMWRGRVASAMRGKRGQKLLTDLLAALDSMPVKALVPHDLETPDGEVCALGALGKARGLDMSKIDPGEPDEVAVAFGVASPLVQEIVYMNDEYYDSIFDSVFNRWVDITPEQRWTRMRAWVASKIQTLRCQ